MWTHELTTSVFVDGFPRKLPSPSHLYGGLYSSLPQKILRLTTKFCITPSVFSKEVSNEASILESLGISLENGNGKLVCDREDGHEKIKSIMNILDIGYKYLYDNFNDYYGSRTYFNVFTNRILNKAKVLIS
jgi:hypothetical protein